jgi:hypothetical protein
LVPIHVRVPKKQHARSLRNFSHLSLWWTIPKRHERVNAVVVRTISYGKSSMLYLHIVRLIQIHNDIDCKLLPMYAVEHVQTVRATHSTL